MSKSILKIPLRDVTITQKGVKPVILKNKPFPESVPYLDINALENEEIREYTFKELGNLASEKDVLVVWDGSRSGLALKGKIGAVGSTIMKLTPVGLDPEYLFYFIKSNYDFINGNITGGGIPHVNSELFFDLLIPYISIVNQKKAVAELQNQLEGNEDILNKQKAVIQQFLSETDILYKKDDSMFTVVQNFRNAVLQKAVCGDLTKEWRAKNNITFPQEYTSLDSVIIEIKSGKSFRCLERPPHKDEIGVLKISAISSFEYRENESKTCIDKEKNNPDLYVKEGDFLMSRANTKELVGSCVIVNNVEKTIMLSDKIWRITYDASKVLDRFVFLFLRSRSGRDQIENYATGTQESMKNITQGDLRNITFYLPSLTEQEEIIRQSDTLIQIADRVQSQYSVAIDNFNNLKKAIMERSFSDQSLSEYRLDSSKEQIFNDLSAEREKLEDERSLFSKNRSKARSNMKKKIAQSSDLDIEDVLKANEGPMTAKEVWKASKFSTDIDAFYEAARHKVPDIITWNLVKEDEPEPESELSLIPTKNED